MKRLSHILLVVLAVCLVLVTASCGLFGSQTTSATTTAPTTTPPITTEPPPAQPPELTTAEKIAAIKDALDDYRLADYGRITVFESPYEAPTVVPTEGAHPRLFFTADDIPAIKAALASAQNATAYQAFIALSETETDGNLADIEGDNADAQILSVIRAKALRYALYGEELYGYQALLAAKHYLLTLNDAESSLVNEALLTFSCVYDWCFKLTGVADQRHLIAGIESHLIPYIDGNYPPSVAQNTSFNRDLFAFAIATANEQPDIYNYVAGAMESEFANAYDSILALGSHPAGSGFGVEETLSMLYAQLFWKNIAGADFAFYGDGLESMAYAVLGYVRPDGEGFRVGDDLHEDGIYSTADHFTAALLASYIYDNADMRASVAPYAMSLMDPISFLLLNDTSLVSETAKDLPLFTSFGDQITVRSSWSDENAYAVYMKIGSIPPHEHTALDAGAFQIFYKGALASGSGYYDGDKTVHQIGYANQTVSVNSLLVYNPSKADTLGYAGGQSLDAWLERGGAKLITSAHATSEDGSSFLWSYLATDLSGAYDADTVDSAKRHMIASATGDAKSPLVFAVYDDITSTDASFKKTFLLHAQTKPVISDNSVSIVNGGGKLVVSSVGSEVVYSAVGGDGNQYIAGDMNFPTNITPPAASESGWGRLEISPKAESLNDKLLTLMYVTDASNTDAPAFYSLDSKHFVGGQVLGQVFYFSKSEELVASNVTLTSEGEGNVHYYVTGLHPGSWELWVKGDNLGIVEVGEDSILSVEAAAGSMTLVPRYARLSYELNGGAEGETKLPSHYYFGKDFVIPTDVTKFGYRFEGWYTTETFDEGSEISVIPADSTDDYKLYAKWSKVFDAVTFEMNGGTAGSEYPTYVNLGESLKLPNDATLDGAIFLGWYLDPNFTGGPIFEIPADHDAAITLYARFAKTLIVKNVTQVNPFASDRATFTVGDDGIATYDFIEGKQGLFDISLASHVVSSSITLSFDIGTVAEKTPAMFAFRFRALEGGWSVDQDFFTCNGGKASLPSPGGSETALTIAELSETEMTRITLVITNDNAGLEAYKASNKDDAVTTTTGASEFKSNLTVKAYANGVYVGERIYRTFVTFGAEYFDIDNPYNGKTCPSTVNRIQYYTFGNGDKAPAGGASLRFSDISISEHERTNGDHVFLNFGGGTTADTDYIEGNAIVKLPTMEKDGMTFIGWYTSPEGDGEAVTSFDGLLSGTELYARYE